MKEFIYSVIKILIFLMLFYICAIIISGYLLPNSMKKNLIYTLGGNGHMFSRMADLKGTKDIDILFLGSSRAYRSFDTRFYDSLNYTSFNLGSSNQTPIQTLYLLQKYIDQINPKIVIFEVNPDIFSNQGVESAIDIISNEPFDLTILNMVLEIKNIKLINTLLFSCFNQLIGNYQSFYESPENNKDIYHHNGFISSKVNDYEENEENEENTYICNFNTKQINAFENIVHILRSQKIEYYLIQSPILKENYDSCNANAEFDSMMKSNNNYINFNEFVDFNDTQYFIDGQHLNQKGVDKFNKKLIHLLF